MFGRELMRLLGITSSRLWSLACVHILFRKVYERDLWQDDLNQMWYQRDNQTVRYVLAPNETAETIAGVPGILIHGLFSS